MNAVSRLDDLHEQIVQQGYGVLEHVIPPHRCAEIRQRVSQAVEQHYASTPVGRTAAERKVGFTPSVINYDQSFAEYLADPRLISITERMLGKFLKISFTSAIINHPGNARGGWHADWPYNQKNAGHFPCPYQDMFTHITTLWMLSPFAAENGGTLVIPGSHRCAFNPTLYETEACSAATIEAASGNDRQLQQLGLTCVPRPMEAVPQEVNAHGEMGSVLLMDSRLWHATAPNSTQEPRVALAVRYAPWWLNLEVLRPESDDRRRMCDEVGRNDNIVPSILPHVFDQLPFATRQLYRHWVQRN